MKRSILLSLYFILVLISTAQVPKNYYTQANGKTGYALKSALCAIITEGHKKIGYDNLWGVYRTTDCRPDGCLWDMYSDTTNYPQGKPSGSYDSEGDIPNREHSFPKSWWGGTKDIKYSDAMHVIPADGYVNNRRGNLPFGETSNPTYRSHNSFSKMGPCDRNIGYSGNVFEPNDEYKGDFARIYFYMATRYQDEIADWSSPMLAGNKDSVYTKWALTMLMRWATEDPVSQKEIDRNNAVHNAQGNRNPFVDFPGLEQYVWGSKRGTPLVVSDYTQPDDSTHSQPTSPSAPVFSIEGGYVVQGTLLTITSPDNLPIYYSIGDSAYTQATSPFNYTIESDVTISAFCMEDTLSSEVVSYSFIITTVEQPTAAVFELISSSADLVPGDRYLIVNESKMMALGAASKDVRSNIAVEINGHTINLNEANTASPTVLQLIKTGDYYCFYIPSEQAYLALLSDANSLKTESTMVNGAQWTIRFSGTNADISNRQYDNRSICYNNSSPRFAAYKSTSQQQPVQLYREKQSITGLKEINAPSTRDKSIYTLDGRRLTPGTQLRPGIYIIGGRKVMVR